MQFTKRHRAYIRPLPRLTESGQRKLVDGCAAVYVEGDKESGRALTLADFIGSLRKGDVAVVAWLHVLAPPRTTTNIMPRERLWKAIKAIEARGATIFEVHTGRSSASKDDRDGMIQDAIEHITSAGRAAASQQNGAKSKGRKPDEIDPDESKRAKDVWHDVRFSSDGAAMAAGPKGWSKYRYRKLFGPSGRGQS